MEEIDPSTGMPVSRRGLARLAAGVAAAGVMPARAAALPSTGGAPVIGFVNGAPWVDFTGRDIPYHPPTATGRFAPDTESLMRLGFFL